MYTKSITLLNMILSISKEMETVNFTVKVLFLVSYSV